MADSAKEPLQSDEGKGASLRFPAAKSAASRTEGAFNSDKGSLFSYLTRRDDFEPPIPGPPRAEEEEAAAKGLDNRTNRLTQPVWLSVLKKRVVPWAWLRCITIDCCFQRHWTLTRAQWLWLMNAVALVVHLIYAFRVGDLSMRRGKGRSMEATVWRVQPMWNATHPTDGYTATLVDNGMPLRVDLLVGGMFTVSALVHGMLVALGPFDRWVFLVWRQLDLAFHWWRYVDMVFSFPLLAMLVCVLLPAMRDESTLTLVWMCMASAPLLMMLVEVWSRPHRNPDKSYDMRRWLGDDAPVDYEGGRPTAEEMQKMALQRARRSANYWVRMLSVGFALIPFGGAWITMLNTFFTQLHDLRLDPRDDIYARAPGFIPLAVMFTLFAQVLYFFPLVWYQWVAPMHFWKTDALYTVLTLITKAIIGQLFIENVIEDASFNDAIALSNNTLAASATAALGNATRA